MRVQNKSALHYIFRNFYHVAFVTLTPAVLMALCFRLSGTSGTVVGLFDGSVSTENATDLLLGDFSFVRFGNNWWIGLVSVVVLALAISTVIAIVGRHMRVGAFETSQLRFALAFFVRLFVYLISMLVFCEALHLAIIGICSLIAPLSNGIIYAVVFTVLEVIAFYFVSKFIAYTMLCFPATYYEDFPLNVALSYSIKTVGHHKDFVNKFVFSFMAIRLVVTVLCYLLSPYKLFGNVNADVVVKLLYFWFYNTLLPVLSFTAYFDFTDGDRRDLSRIIVG